MKGVYIMEKNTEKMMKDNVKIEKEAKKKAKHEKEYAIAVDRLFAEGKMIDCICSKNVIRF